MHLHAIGSCTIVCANLDRHIDLYRALGFVLLSRASMDAERVLALGLQGHFERALLAVAGEHAPCLELIETTQPLVSPWRALEISVPRLDLRRTGLPKAMTVSAAGSTHNTLIQVPDGETLHLREHPWSELSPLNRLNSATVAAQAPKLSAAFYLGLGATGRTEAPSATEALVQLGSMQQLAFRKRAALVQSPAYGIFMLSLARRCARAQAGPQRILRGPDHEQIELV